MEHSKFSANNINKISKSAIHEMTRLSKQYDDVAFLSWAKPVGSTPAHINKATAAAITRGKAAGYSNNQGLPELRQLIVEKLQRDNNIQSDISEIIVTVGAIEGLASAVFATVDPGDEVILPDPTYSTHIRQVQLASGVPVLVPLLEENNYLLDLDGIRQSITPTTKAIMYCSPSNPTGSVFPEEQLRELAKIAVENDLVVITDEAYEYFVYDNNKHFSIGSIPEVKQQVISVFTFTKSYAMTGWRVGYLHADPGLIGSIKKAHIPFAICAPVASQYAAIAALEGSQDCIGEFKEHYIKTRNLMCNRLDGLSEIFDYVKPAGSYLMFPRIKVPEGRDSFEFCKTILEKAKVSTTPGIAFGTRGESHLRLSFCVTEEMINKGFDRLEKHFGI